MMDTFSCAKDNDSPCMSSALQEKRRADPRAVEFSLTRLAYSVVLMGEESDVSWEAVTPLWELRSQKWEFKDRWKGSAEVVGLLMALCRNVPPPLCYVLSMYKEEAEVWKTGFERRTRAVDYRHTNGEVDSWQLDEHSENIESETSEEDPYVE